MVILLRYIKPKLYSLNSFFRENAKVSSRIFRCTCEVKKGVCSLRVAVSLFSLLLRFFSGLLTIMLSSAITLQTLGFLLRLEDIIQGLWW